MLKLPSGFVSSAGLSFTIDGSSNPVSLMASSMDSGIGLTSTPDCNSEELDTSPTVELSGIDRLDSSLVPSSAKLLDTPPTREESASVLVSRLFAAIVFLLSSAAFLGG